MIIMIIMIIIVVIININKLRLRGARLARPRRRVEAARGGCAAATEGAAHKRNCNIEPTLTNISINS